ncbi:MAG TPA: chemotaxis protein CheD [Gemmatimonadaceae bacterium]|nr:chemotaxis protein CheD [Gemmatimonadaceae bacterium]
MTETRVRVADAAVLRGVGILSTVGLGSCVAIALYDPEAAVGGLAHIMLPSETMSKDRCNRAKFPSSAVPLLLERMRGLGARDERIRARIVGGASMFTSLLPAGGLQMGERNLLATRTALARAQIPIIAEEVGGEHGRSVYLHVGDGRLEVRSMMRGNVVL